MCNFSFQLTRDIITRCKTEDDSQYYTNENSYNSELRPEQCILPVFCFESFVRSNTLLIWTPCFPWQFARTLGGFKFGLNITWRPTSAKFTKHVFEKSFVAIKVGEIPYCTLMFWFTHFIIKHMFTSVFLKIFSHRVFAEISTANASILKFFIPVISHSLIISYRESQKGLDKYIKYAIMV